MENTEGRKVIANNLEGRAFCAKDIERILRANGWHHGDDEVKGKTVKGEMCRGFYDDAFCNDDLKASDSCPARCRFPSRPATIKDLIT